MRSLVIVRLLPDVNDASRVGQIGEPVDIEAHMALIAELPVEALQVPVLAGFARLDEIQSDAVRIGPGIQGLPGELRAVVDCDLFRGAIRVHTRSRAAPGSGPPVAPAKRCPPRWPDIRESQYQAH